MKDIIFRGKREDTGEWVFGNLFVSDTDRRTYILAGSRRVTIEWEVDPYTIGQYTGRKDKNGKEIFEGDILKLNTGKPHIIVFKCGSFQLTDTAIPICFSENFEIIGNIHDNQELVKKECMTGGK